MTSSIIVFAKKVLLEYEAYDLEGFSEFAFTETTEALAKITILLTEALLEIEDDMERNDWKARRALDEAELIVVKK